MYLEKVWFSDKNVRAIPQGISRKGLMTWHSIIFVKSHLLDQVWFSVKNVIREISEGISRKGLMTDTQLNIIFVKSHSVSWPSVVLS